MLQLDDNLIGSCFVALELIPAHGSKIKLSSFSLFTPPRFHSTLVIKLLLRGRWITRRTALRHNVSPLSFPITLFTVRYTTSKLSLYNSLLVPSYLGISRFYDISGMLSDPEAFQLTISIFVSRYQKLDVDCVAGLDARGFVLGPPIALALKKPFVMIRKKGKLPNAVTGNPYMKEYNDGFNVAGNELCASKAAVQPGQRVLVIDDLVATGGTLIAACDLLSSIGAVVVECACVVELKALGGYEKLQKKHKDVKVWGLISEDLLTLDGEAPTA
jgi:adenine phosphoribosyltransferase